MIPTSSAAQILPLLAIGFALASCSAGEGGNETLPPRPGEPVRAVAQMLTASGAELGQIQLVEKAGGLAIVVSLSGLGPAEHAFHLHTTGACEAPDFKSAGGHLNPFGRAHGSLAEDGAHLGDLPNLAFGDDQSAETEIALEGDAAGLLEAILDSDGTAVMLHAGPDDYVTDPTGAAGARIACGVLVKA